MLQIVLTSLSFNFATASLPTRSNVFYTYIYFSFSLWYLALMPSLLPSQCHENNILYFLLARHFISFHLNHPFVLICDPVAFLSYVLPMKSVETDDSPNCWAHCMAVPVSAALPSAKHTTSCPIFHPING